MTALRDYNAADVKRMIGPWKYPRWIEFFDSLPKTATGKIQRFVLRSMVSQTPADRNGNQPDAQSLAPRLAILYEFHRRFALGLAESADREVDQRIDRTDVDRTFRVLVRALGDAGWLKAVVPATYGGISEQLDVRTLCSAREILASNDSLVDFRFAMQGLGTGSIFLFGTDHLKAKYLPPVRDGRHIAAFALSEPEAGSDVSVLATTATADGPGFVRLDGLKTWISNGGIADPTWCSRGRAKQPAREDYPRSLSMPTRPGFKSPAELK